MLTPTLSPITGRLVEGGSVFLPVKVQRTCPLEAHEGTVSIGGRTITNLRFADDTDGIAGEEEELANLAERLDKASTAYGMEMSAEKTKY